MLAINGYFDGESFQPLEKISAKPNQRVIITIMNEFINSDEIPNQDSLEALKEVEYMKKHPEEFKGWQDVDEMIFCLNSEVN